MSGTATPSISIPNDAEATIGLRFTDAAGNSVAGPVSGATLAWDTPGVCDATMVNNGQAVALVPLVVGPASATVTYTDALVTASLLVNVIIPVANAAAFDTGGASFIPNPNPPTAAPTAAPTVAPTPTPSDTPAPTTPPAGP